MLGADGVHLGRTRRGERRAPGSMGSCSGSPRRASRRRVAADGEADYIGAGPVWETPSKADADPAIGLDGLREICAAADVPVVAIGGIDATNAADCIRAGAAGVAVVRAARDAATREGGDRCSSLSSASSACSQSSNVAGWRAESSTMPRSSDGGLVATQDALVEGVHFRLDWISWRDLGWRAAAVNLSDLAASGAEPEGLLVTLAAPPETDVRRRSRALRGHRRDGGSRARRRHDAGGSAGAERHRDRPLDARAGQGGRAPGRSARRDRAARRVPVRRSAREDVRASSASAGRGEGARRARTRACSTSRTGSPSTPDTSRGARAAASSIDLEHVPLADGAELDDLGFGEDYELLAAVEDRGRFRVDRAL